MNAWSSVLSIAHLIGLALAIGSSTVKVALLLRCRADAGFVPTYAKVAPVMTRLIVLGMILLTFSGIGWLVMGYPLTNRLIGKLILVGAIGVMGPLIDKVAEPRFYKLAPPAGEEPRPAFVQAQARYVAMEITATLLFYVILVLWVLR